MLLYSQFKTTAARAGVVAIAALSASVAMADSYQWPLTVSSVVNFNRTSVSSTNFSQFATGQNHTVALTGGVVYTWGDSNTSGQLGRSGDETTPTAVTAFENTAGTGIAAPTIIDIAAGDTFTAVLDDAGNIYFTGVMAGQTSRTTFRQIANPLSGSTPLVGKDIAAGGGHLIAVFLRTSGTKYSVQTIGSNTDGQCGTGNTTTVSSWTAVTAVSDRSTQQKSIAGGAKHTVVIENDGKVWAFGDNSQGQLGNNTQVDATTPVACQDSAGTQIATGSVASAGFDQSLILTTGGTVFSAGGDDMGQAGRDGNLLRFATVGVNGISSISAGYKYNMALDSTGNLYRFGFLVRTGDYAETMMTPTATPGFSGISAIHAGDRVIAQNTSYTGLLNKTGGYSCVASTGTTPLFKRRYLLNDSATLVQWLSGGANGFVQIEIDSTSASDMTFNVASDSAELQFTQSSGTILAGQTTVNIPISTTAVDTRTNAFFTVTQDAGWVLPNRPVALRAPVASSITVANNNMSVVGVKGGVAKATVTLNYPAPASGTFTLDIVSANTAIVTSGTVTFEAGATTGTALLTVTPVTTKTGVSLLVNSDGPKARTLANVLPPTLKTATVPTPEIIGGLATTLTLGLDSGAPSSWTPTITFTDLAGNPVSVASTSGSTTFDAGTGTLNVTINTDAVLARTPIFIVTTINGITKKTRLTLLKA